MLNFPGLSVSKFHEEQDPQIFPPIKEAEMNTRTALTALLLLLLITTIAFAQPMHDRKMPKGLNLTDTQQEQFEKISFDMQKKQIELTAKLALLKLEMKRLMDADQLDKSAIEKKMNEMAAQTIALRMNHLTAWSEKNKLLNADQQKNWKKNVEESSPHHGVPTHRRFPRRSERPRKTEDAPGYGTEHGR
jgi:Spy/CpxP family protein refolding chaperone